MKCRQTIQTFLLPHQKLYRGHLEYQLVYVEHENMSAFLEETRDHTALFL